MADQAQCSPGTVVLRDFEARYQPSSARSIPVRITQRSQSRPSGSNNSKQARVLRPIPRAERHALTPVHHLSFGLLNVRSFLNKVEEVLEIRKDHSLDVMLLTETWHDSDSVCLRRLRCRGFTVSDCPRPRAIANSLCVNHGGVAVFSAPGVHHRLYPLDFNVSTFEATCVKLSFLSFSCVVLLIYRTGPVSSLFFGELTVVVEHLSTLSCPVFITGDMNVHFERLHDTHAIALTDLFSSFVFFPSC